MHERYACQPVVTHEGQHGTLAPTPLAMEDFDKAEVNASLFFITCEQGIEELGLECQ